MQLIYILANMQLSFNLKEYAKKTIMKNSDNVCIKINKKAKFIMYYINK